MPSWELAFRSIVFQKNNFHGRIILWQNDSNLYIFIAQAELQLSYRDRKLKHDFKADFVCYGKIIVELKAVSKLIGDHRAQLLNYLSATGMKLGILVNFSHYPSII